MKTFTFYRGCSPGGLACRNLPIRWSRVGRFPRTSQISETLPSSVHSSDNNDPLYERDPHRGTRGSFAMPVDTCYARYLDPNRSTLEELVGKSTEYPPKAILFTRNQLLLSRIVYALKR